MINCVPEQSLTVQDDPPGDWFLIYKGDCEVFVKDFTYKDRFVKALFPGMYFGEISIITNQNRTATVKSKNYATIGQTEIQKFQECLS